MEEIRYCYLCEKKLDKWNASWNTFNRPICGDCCLVTINSKIKEREIQEGLRGTKDWFVHEAGKYQ
jgi:hypothetical protein